jgi:hypothetical protein
VGLQGRAGEPKKHTQKGGDLNQFRIPEFDFELTPRMHQTSDLDVLYIHGKLRR